MRSFTPAGKLAKLQLATWLDCLTTPCCLLELLKGRKPLPWLDVERRQNPCCGLVGDPGSQLAKQFLRRRDSGSAHHTRQHGHARQDDGAYSPQLLGLNSHNIVRVGTVRTSCVL